VRSCHRLVEEQDLGLACERPRQGDPLPLAARELGRLGLRELADPEPLEQVARLAPRERHVALDREVREQRVLLEHVADRTLLGPPVDPAIAVEPDLAVRRDEPLRRFHQPRGRPQHGRLARAGGADECDRLGPDVERYLDVEVTSRNLEIEPSRAHVKTLRPTSIAAPTRMKSALIARATSKSWSNSA
jgi:hypothetical protein